MYYIKSVAYNPAENKNQSDKSELTQASVVNWENLKTDSICPDNLSKIANESPTKLGELAANNALREAKLEVADINLVIGETATPMQVTPSEAQRIAGAIGLKTTAFDIQSGNASFGACLEYLNNTLDDKADNILWVSANTPTRLVGSLDNANNFSDAGSAVVISSESGIAKITHSEYLSDLSIKPIIEVKPFSEIIFNKENIDTFYSTYLDSTLKSALLKLKDKSKAKFILPNYCSKSLKSLLAKHEIEEASLIKNKFNTSLGSTFSDPLSCALNNADFNEILIIQGGAGFGQASIILERS